MHSPADPQEFLSTREAASRLGAAVRTVQLWVESGVLRAWKTAGGHRRITRESVDALLAARAAAVAGPAAEPAGQPARVLVVEDDPALRLLFELTLATWALPIVVDVADNGFSALLRLGEGHTDLLITDLNMPGMDGFAMLRHLRAHAQWQALPVIAVTALSAPEIAARGGLPDDVPVLAKPVPFDQLRRMVETAIGAPARGD